MIDKPIFRNQIYISTSRPCTKNLNLLSVASQDVVKRFYGKRFSYKHVRDNHEKSVHVYTPGDFVESDEQFQSRPRGGRKRTIPSVEMLIRKRVTPPQVDNTVDQNATFNCSHMI
ncbi:hypothetical protein SLA2020_491390 [Shorea laevis]